MIKSKIRKIQHRLQAHQIDGWLFYDFRRSNDIACNLLELPSDRLLTRRFFYWVPGQNDPVKVVSAIEDAVLDHLPGAAMKYRTWQELESHLNTILKHSNRIAMEYSPRNALPYISKVDGGTVELVRSCGVEVISSANLLQEFTSVWDDHKLSTHLAAADILDQIASLAWKYISDALKAGNQITEKHVQAFMLEQFALNGCVSSDPPICAVNEHAANPHFSPDHSHNKIIKKGDFILIDLWCKQNRPRAVYADITRVGVADSRPANEQKKVFSVVRNAQKAATRLIEQRLNAKLPVMGCEADQECRRVVEEAGYGEFFIHRTGHNIDESDHGPGAHLDNYETRDTRELIPGTCFSVEPGIYLPGKFGIRLEYDVYIHFDRSIQITGGIQDEIVCLL